MSKSPGGMMWLVKKPLPGLASICRLTPDLRQVVLRDQRDLSSGLRVVEDVANNQLFAVFLPELAVELPAESVEFLLGLVRVVGDGLAVVLVACWPAT